MRRPAFVLTSAEVLMRVLRWLIPTAGGAATIIAGSASVAAEAGSGLVATGWSRTRVAEVRAEGFRPTFRSRVVFGLTGPVDTASAPSFSPAIISARLLGDYYFSRPTAANGRAEGFRATSGLLVGSRLGTWIGAPSAALGLSTVSIERRGSGLLTSSLDAAGRDVGVDATVPYVGIGYSNAFDKGRWGISADLGLMALRSGNGLRLGRALGMQGADDALRDMRLSPMLQLGVSYSF